MPNAGNLCIIIQIGLDLTNRCDLHSIRLYNLYDCLWLNVDISITHSVSSNQDPIITVQVASYGYKGNLILSDFLKYDFSRLTEKN